MKYLLPALLFFFSSCISVDKHNEKLNIPVPVEKLREDIDFTHRKLEELHPKLYWHLPKEKLNYQFDSLKSALKNPLKPNEFYIKLAPIIVNIKEGHLRLFPLYPRLTKKEIKNSRYDQGLFSRYNFLIRNDQIYVKDNLHQIPNMETGTEILKINDLDVSSLLKKYRPFVNSDGENTTFQNYSMAFKWPALFTTEYGTMDSVKLETKYNNCNKTFYIHRKIVSKEEREKNKEENKKLIDKESWKTKDYNIATRSFNRDLQFLRPDSAIAYMKIKTFSGTNSAKFYKQSFEKIKQSPAKYLVLDVRDNLGGSLAEIHNLYSYLVPTKFKFINDMEVTSRTSMFKADYFKKIPAYAKPLAALTYPFYLVGTGLSVKKQDDKFYLKNNNLFALKKPKKNNFEGKIYVLINGSSFSASSIIASKLKADERAFLVGEETGGANDGTVAGRYSTITLPNSELVLPVGLMAVQPNIQFEETGKGVVPHKIIIPTLQEVLKKKDVQLDWILNEIENNR